MMKIVWGILVFLGLGRRIWKRRINKRIRTYIKTISEHKESYSKQLNKLKELLETESIDEVTFERMKKIVETDYVKKREQAKIIFNSHKA